MRSQIIVSSDQEPHAVGSLAVPLGTDLHLVPEVTDHPTNKVAEGIHIVYCSDYLFSSFYQEEIVFIFLLP